MQAPKKKTSTSRRDMRRSHDALSPVIGTVCKSCGEPVRQHSVCPSCGFYRDRFYKKNAPEARQ